MTFVGLCILTSIMSFSFKEMMGREILITAFKFANNFPEKV